MSQQQWTPVHGLVDADVALICDGIFFIATDQSEAAMHDNSDSRYLLCTADADGLPDDTIYHGNDLAKAWQMAQDWAGAR